LGARKRPFMNDGERGLEMLTKGDGGDPVRRRPGHWEPGGCKKEMRGFRAARSIVRAGDGEDGRAGD